MLAFSRSLRVALCLLALILAASRHGDAIAQVGNSSRDSSSPLELLQQRIQRNAGSSTVVPLEGPVDPNEYIVGPGDVFSIIISSIESVAAAIPVTADGHLMLPDAGAVNVAGSTLAGAIETAMTKLQQRYRNVEVSISLASPRQFYVHVVGAVTAPGRYVVMPVSRVSDALTFAYMDTTRVPVGNPDFQPALRNVTVYRRDGSKVPADLMAYLAAGTTDLNPYLRDGDIVSVPAYNPEEESVSISGHVPFSGTYDYRNGESVRDLVTVATGVDKTLLAGEVRVSRWISGESVDEIVSLDAGGGSDYYLRARDHVFVLPEELTEGFAHVEGRVRFPGSYPIVEGKTSVAALIRMAGGYREDALLRGAYLVRDLPTTSPETEITRHVSSLRSPGSALAPVPAEPLWMPYLLTAPSEAALRNVRLSDLDFLNRTYLAQEMQLQNRVSIDLESETDGTFLMNGDRLHIPRDDGTVFVFGQVNMPGFVPYVAGHVTSDYIRTAGGLGGAAEKVFLMEAGTRRFREGDGVSVRSGDMVFVSRTADTADSAELQRILLEDRRFRAETRSRTIGIVLQTISAVGTVVALIVSLGK